MVLRSSLKTIQTKMPKMLRAKDRQPVPKKAKNANRVIIMPKHLKLHWKLGAQL